MKAHAKAARKWTHIKKEVMVASWMVKLSELAKRGVSVPGIIDECHFSKQSRSTTALLPHGLLAGNHMGTCEATVEGGRNEVRG